MDAKKFKETYLQWSKVVIIAVAFILNAIVMCDHFLGFDFSKNCASYQLGSFWPFSLSPGSAY